jgi:putative lipase involved disintegration of autophagic bodies
MPNKDYEVRDVSEDWNESEYARFCIKQEDGTRKHISKHPRGFTYKVIG